MKSHLVIMARGVYAERTAYLVAGVSIPRLLKMIGDSGAETHALAGVERKNVFDIVVLPSPITLARWSAAKWAT